jgi:hypothetical protein
MTLAPLSQQCRRIIALQEQLTDVIGESECSWAETVGAVGFALAVVIDCHEEQALRVAMAQRVADKLVAGAWMRGSFGERERMQ